MKQHVAVGIVAVALVGGSATGLVVREMRSDAAEPVSSSTRTSTPTPTPTPSASPEPSASTPTPKVSATPSTSALLPVGSLQIDTGAVGPVRVGMTKKQAAATGYFNTDVESQNCPVPTPLEWTSNYYNVLDVYLTQDATISSIGVRGTGPKTRSGLQINSTYAEVKKVLGAHAKPQDAGYLQTGLFVNDGDAWIGFLFDAQPGSIENGDSVTFIEVTRGMKPGLMRDGC